MFGDVPSWPVMEAEHKRRLPAHSGHAPPRHPQFAEPCLRTVTIY